MEEIGIMGTLAESGYVIDIYPGDELILFEKISEGKFKNIPPSLLKRISVVLDVKSNKQRGKAT